MYTWENGFSVCPFGFMQFFMCNIHSSDFISSNIVCLKQEVLPLLGWLCMTQPPLRSVRCVHWLAPSLETHTYDSSSCPCRCWAFSGNAPFCSPDFWGFSLSKKLLMHIHRDILFKGGFLEKHQHSCGQSRQLFLNIHLEYSVSTVSWKHRWRLQSHKGTHSDHKML